MPEADEEIRTRITVEADEAIEKARQYREEIDQVKVKALQASAEQKVALKDLEVAYISLLKSQKEAKIASLQQTLLSPLVSEKDVQAQIQDVTKQYNAQIAITKAAFKEARDEEAKYFASQAALIKESQKEQQAVAKQSVDDAKNAAKEKLAVIKNDVAFRRELEKQAQAELKAQNKEVSAAAMEYAKITKQGYGIMSEGAQKYGEQVKSIKQEIQNVSATTGQSFQQVAQGLVNAGTPINQVNQALRELDTQTKKTSGGFRLFGQEIRGVGDIARLVFGSILGITAVSAIRNLIRALGDATQSAIEFAKSQFALEIGVRALQRSGVEITIKDVYENLDILREKFGLFSEKELVVGTAALLNLVRSFNFTKEQIFELQDAITTLAIVNGRAMDDVQRTVALAISSGYTEGLQRLGVSINRVTIAMEAQRLGFGRNYMSLTEQQRALATYNLILQKTALYSGDVEVAQEQAFGRLQKTKSEIVDVVRVIGENFIPFTIAFNDAWLKIIETVNSAITTFKQLLVIGTGVFGGLTAAVAIFSRSLKEAVAGGGDFNDFISNLSPDELGKYLADAFKSGMDQFQLELSKSLGLLEEGDILGDVEIGVKDMASRVEEILGGHLDDLRKLQEDFDADMEEEALDHNRQIEDITRDSARRRLEIWINYQQKLEEIGINEQRDIAEANIRYQQDVAKTIRQFNLRRAELEARYRENEKKAEIKFQEDLRRLREGFLFDLEDALHERDARQVLRLIRQYNLQKDQLTRQYDIENDERKRQFKLELEELEHQKQERLRILAEEHAARIAEIQRQAQYEREAALRQYLQQIEDESRREEQRREDEARKWEQEKEDLRRRFDEKLLEIVEAMTKEAEVTAELAEEIRKALEKELGPGGAVDKIYDYLVGRIWNATEATIAAFARLRAAYQSIANIGKGIGGGGATGGKSGGGFPYTPVTSGGGRQTGGPVEAGKSYSVAEKGIEVFTRPGTFIPDVGGQVYNQDQFLDLMNKQTSRGGEGKVRIGVSLSPDLVGSIIENTLGQVSDVVFELERKRR